MFPMSRVRSHSTSLSKCTLIRMQGIWSYSNGLSTPDTTSGTPACHHRQDSNTRHHTRSTSQHHHQDRYRHSRSRSQSHPHRYQSYSHHDSTEAIPGHIIETEDTTIGVLHNAVTPVLIIIAMTHHIEDHPHIGVLQLIQKIATDPDHAQHINQVRKLHIKLHPVLAELQLNLKIGDIPES